MKFRHTLALPLLFAALLAASSPAARAAPPTPPQAPPEVSRAAAEGLPRLLSHLPPGEESDYGFADAAESLEAQLLPPFLLHAVTPDALRAWSPGDAPNALLSPTTLWYFPVAVRGEVRCVLVVDLTPSGWEAVSLGYAPLAASLDALLRAWPGTGDSRPALAASFQAREYLFHVPSHPEPNLTILELAPSGPGRRAPAPPFNLQNPADAVARLLPAVEQNLAEFGPRTGGAQ